VVDHTDNTSATIISYYNKNMEQNVSNKIKKTYLPSLNATQSIIRGTNMENKNNRLINYLQLGWSFGEDSQGKRTV